MAAAETTIFTALVSGAFGVGAAVVTWGLKSKSDAKERVLAKEEEHREELKALYTSVFIALEQLIRHTKAGEEYPVDENLSDVNAKVHLLASEAVADKYSEAAALLVRWSRLHVLATPRKMKVGDQTYEMIQAPDPTAKHKQPEADAYAELQKALSALVQTMRVELRDAA